MKIYRNKFYFGKVLICDHWPEQQFIISDDLTFWTIDLIEYSVEHPSAKVPQVEFFIREIINRVHRTKVSKQKAESLFFDKQRNKEENDKEKQFLQVDVHSPGIWSVARWPRCKTMDRKYWRIWRSLQLEWDGDLLLYSRGIYRIWKEK